MIESKKLLKKGVTLALTVIFPILCLGAGPNPTPDLDTPIGEAFSRLKESIAVEDKQSEGDTTAHDALPGHLSEVDEHLEHPEGQGDKLEEISSDLELERAPVSSTHDSENRVEEFEHSPFTTELAKADYLQQNGSLADAIKVYLNLLNIADVPPVEHKQALFGLAETYYKRGSLAQSVSLLSQFLTIFPDDERRADIQFQIGLLYREMQLYGEAVTAFYRVLNSIVVTGEVNLTKYLSLARRSQFEIARSHYFAEEWEQSLVILSRIELFELNPTDRESLLYYKAHATLKNGDREEGLRIVKNLLRTYPTSPLVPEMLYTKAEILAEMQQEENAIATLMELLEVSGLPNEAGNEAWSYWRQQAGNKFANRYFENQDFLAALRLYQGIAVLDESAIWQLSIVYQMALCFEKLGMYDRAEESLRFVSQGVEELSDDKEKPADVVLAQLNERAKWRLDMLQWRAGLERDRLPMLAEVADLESEED